MFKVVNTKLRILVTKRKRKNFSFKKSSVDFYYILTDEIIPRMKLITDDSCVYMFIFYQLMVKIKKVQNKGFHSFFVDFKGISSRQGLFYS